MFPTPGTSRLLCLPQELQDMSYDIEFKEENGLYTNRNYPMAWDEPDYVSENKSESEDGSIADNDPENQSEYKNSRVAEPETGLVIEPGDVPGTDATPGPKLGVGQQGIGHKRNIDMELVDMIVDKVEDEIITTVMDRLEVRILSTLEDRLTKRFRIRIIRDRLREALQMDELTPVYHQGINLRSQYTVYAGLDPFVCGGS